MELRISASSFYRDSREDSYGPARLQPEGGSKSAKVTGGKTHSSAVTRWAC